MNAITERRSHAVALRGDSAEDVHAAASAYCALSRASYLEPQHLATALSAARPWLIDGVHERLVAASYRMVQPATEAEIRETLAVLIGSFPAAARIPSPEVFARALLADVAAKRPSHAALDMACAKLRRSCRFVPSIAEVLEALEPCERNVRASANLIERMPSLVADSEDTMQRIERLQRRRSQCA